MKNFACVLILLLSSYVAVGQQTDKEIILKIMDDQTICWNQGDLECFMEAYWKSEDLKFIGSRGISYGWQNTLDNYKKGYPNLTAMGKLKFDILYTEPIGTDHYFVIGKFYLTREIDDLQGHFTLLWRKIDSTWVIIADHSS